MASIDTYTDQHLVDGNGHPVDQDGRPLPPHDTAAEQVVLGTLMSSTEARTEAQERQVTADSFWHPRHQELYRVITELADAAAPVGPVAVNNALQQRGTLARVGQTYVVEVYGMASPVGSNGSYIDILQDKSHRRLLQQTSTTITQLVTQGGDATSVLETARDALTEVIDSSPGVAATQQHVGHSQRELLDHLERIRSGDNTGLTTGFVDLDDVTNGLHSGQLVTVAARPGLGKSAFALDLARTTVRYGHAALFFSLEMSKIELLERFYSAESRIRLADMRSGKMSDDDWTRLARRMGETHEAELYIDDSPTITIGEIRAKARRMQQHTDLQLVVVDYLQLMPSSGRERREQDVSEVSRNLKLLAKELGIPVVALSQLNRGPEQRQDKKPQLADLRESGSIEQDSDVVLFVHRPDAYERDDPRMGEADLMLAKHRAGPTSTVTVAHQLHYSRFVDMAEEV